MMKYKAWAVLVLCNLFWAGNMIFGKYTAVEFPAIWMVFLRWVIALVFLIPMAQFIEKPSWLQVWKKNWVLILLLSASGIVIYNFLTYTSLQYTSSMNSSLINSLTPALIMLLSMVFLKEKISVFQILGLITSFTGVLIVLTKGNLLQVFHAPYNKGDAVMVLSIVFWAVFSLLGKKAKHISSVTLVALTAICGALLMLPFLFTQPLLFKNVTSAGMMGVIYLGIFPSVGSFIFWNNGIKLLGAGTAGISMNLLPVFTAVLAFLLGQGLAATQMMGGVIVIAGMLLTSIKRKQIAPQKGLSLCKA
jgi:drug/metabolite transporter (DMT)-like permease